MCKLKPTITFTASATGSNVRLRHCGISLSVPELKAIAKSLQDFILTFPPEVQDSLIVTVVPATKAILVQDSVGRVFHVKHSLRRIKVVKMLASVIRFASLRHMIAKRPFDAIPAGSLAQALKEGVKECQKK